MGLAENGLEESGNACPPVEISGRKFGRIAYRSGALCNVSAPTLPQTVLVLHTLLQFFSVAIAEMHQIQAFAYVEIMTFDAMETATPHAGTCNN